MATAAPVINSSAVRNRCIFCHICQKKFQSAEVKCPECNGEFVEEVEETSVTEVPRIQQQTLYDHDSDDEDSRDSAGRRRRGDNLGESLGRYLLQLMAARDQLEDSENYLLPVIPPPPQFLDLMFRSSRAHRTHTSRDYSAPGALDSLMTRLLEQLGDIDGPPPAEESKIKSLDELEIQQSHVDEELDCSICREPFKLQDKCRSLPCQHIFHNDCIVPWLQLRDTCPTCRYSLNKGKILPPETPPTASS